MGRRKPSLVAEIGRLLAEYPEEDWRALAGHLRDGTVIENIADAIDELLRSGIKPVKKTTRARPKPRSDVIRMVAREDEAKAASLEALKSCLTNKDKRVPLAHVRSLGNSLGIKEELPNRREQAVNQIIRYLAAKTTGEIDDVVSAVTTWRQGEGREYERWVKLILGRSSGNVHEPQERGLTGTNKSRENDRAS